jgi:hypothetical protein
MDDEPKKKLVSNCLTSSSSCHERFEGLCGRCDVVEQPLSVEDDEENGCVKVSAGRGK